MATDYTAQITAAQQAVSYTNPTSGDLAVYNAELNNGTTMATVDQQIVNSAFVTKNVDPVIALYQAAFGRVPDAAGLKAEVQAVEAGVPLAPTSATSTNSLVFQFASSPEFTARYGVTATSPSSQALVYLLYQNVLGRSPDAAGLAYWTAQPLNAQQLLAAFALPSLDPEYANRVSPQIKSYEYDETGATGSQPVPTTGSLFSVQVNAGSTATSTATAVALTTGTDTVNGANVAITGVLAATNPFFFGGTNQSTLNVFDVINPTGASNSITLTELNGVGLSANVSPVLNNVQTINSTAIAQATANTLTGIAPSVTTLGVVGGTASVEYDGFSGAQVNTFNVTNVNSALAATFTINDAAAQAAATVNVSGDAANAAGAGQATVQLAGQGFKAVTVTSSGTATGGNDLVSLTDAALTTLTVTGTAALKIDGNIQFATTVDVEAGGDQGGVNLNVSGNTTSVKFVGGSGVNTFEVSEASLINSSTSLNGGSGTTNTLEVLKFGTNATQDYAAINAATGFTTLGLVDATDTVDASQLTSIKSFLLAAGNGNDTITNIASGSTVTVLHTGATDTLTAAVAPGAGLTLALGNATSAGITEQAAVTGFQTIALSSNGTAANTLTLTGVADNTVFNVTGSDALTLKVSTGNTLTGDTINASAFTGTLTLTDSGKGDLISTGSGTTTVTETGPAFDTLTFLSGHTKVDTFVSSGTASTTQSTIDKVTNFTFNQDVLKEAGLKMGTTLTQGTELNATAGSGIVGTGNGGFANAAAFITAAEATKGNAGDVVAYVDGTNTYVAEFNNAGAAHIVELVGVTATAVGGTGAGHILLG